MLKIILIGAAIVAAFFLFPTERANACHDNHSDPGVGHQGCGVPAPIAAAGLPALFTLIAGAGVVLRRRRKK